MPFNTFSGFYTSVLSASNGVPMESVKDYEDYIARLRDIERYFSENIANMREGIATGFTLPRVVIENVLPAIEAQLYDDPEQSSLYRPFISMSSKISSSEQARLRLVARDVLRLQALPEFASLAEFLKTEYMPAATA